MPHKLTWYVANEVLYLGLEGNLDAQELKEINAQMADALKGASGRVALMLDASALAVGYATIDSLRMTQTYRDHQKLEMIIGIADNKLNRLIILLSFNLSRARLIQFDSQTRARTYMAQKGWFLPVSP